MRQIKFTHADELRILQKVPVVCRVHFRIGDTDQKVCLLTYVEADLEQFMDEHRVHENRPAKKRCKYCGLTTKHLRGCPMNPFRHKLKEALLNEKPKNKITNSSHRVEK